MWQFGIAARPPKMPARRLGMRRPASLAHYLQYTCLFAGWPRTQRQDTHHGTVNWHCFRRWGIHCLHLLWLFHCSTLLAGEAMCQCLFTTDQCNHDQKVKSCGPGHTIKDIVCVQWTVRRRPGLLGGLSLGWVLVYCEYTEVFLTLIDLFCCTYVFLTKCFG